MTLISAVKNEGNSAQIKFLIESDKFKTEVDALYKKKAPGITIPGFRKGKAPRAMVEKFYGKGFCYEEAINNLLDSEWPKALEASGLDVVSRPEIDIEDINDNGVTVIANVKVKPEIKLGEYKGLEAVKNVGEVTNEEIESELQKIRNRNSRTTEITDRAAENGDTVTIDYSGSTDGKKFEGGTAEKQSLVLGSGSFIPGFEEQVTGHNVGDSFDIQVKFPEEYHAPELAGKDATFSIVLHKIEKTELPELDDDFAKDVSEFDTLDEYKADISAKLKSGKEAQADSEVENSLIQKIVETCEVDIPSEMIDAETENLVRDYDNRLRMNGLDLKTYFQYTGLDLDALREQMRPQAENQVKIRLALEKIVSLENIEVSEEEIEKEYSDISSYYNMESEQVKGLIDAKDISADLAAKKAVKLIVDNAVITQSKSDEPKETAPEAPTAAEESEAGEKPVKEKKTTKRTSKKKAESDAE